MCARIVCFRLSADRCAKKFPEGCCRNIYDPEGMQLALLGDLANASV
jgi:hypothetical protein